MDPTAELLAAAKAATEFMRTGVAASHAGTSRAFTLWDLEDAIEAFEKAQQPAPDLASHLAYMLDVYWGEGDGHDPAPQFILDAKAALIAAVGDQAAVDALVQDRHAAAADEAFEKAAREAAASTGEAA